MTDWRKQFETKEFDRSARPAKVCFSWTSLESFVQEIQANERAKVIAAVEALVPKWIDNPYGETPYTQGRKDERAELRAKLAEYVFDHSGVSSRSAEK